MNPLALIALLSTLAMARPIHDAIQRPNTDPELPRLVIYYQTTHDPAGRPISMLPLATEKYIALTHLIICSFHINPDVPIHLNDFPPDDPHFETVWAEARVLRNAGVTVMGMIGGASPGSFTTQTLDSTDPETFELYYAQLRDAIAGHDLQGMDLDVEQTMSQVGAERLMTRLRQDFGDGFVVTLAPVASALRRGGANLSGFDYALLEKDVGGEDVAFYNAQFYNGFGSLDDTSAFDAVVAAGWEEARRVVVGQLTAPENGGQYVPVDRLNATAE